MSKRYTIKQKQKALQHLAETGSVRLTSQETAIPERTLRSWRTADHTSADPADPAQVYEELKDLRRTIMHHVRIIAATLSDDPEFVNNRAVALARLLDRVTRIDSILAEGNPAEPQVFRIEYVYPDGSIHNVPISRSDGYRTGPYTPPSLEEVSGSRSFEDTIAASRTNREKYYRDAEEYWARRRREEAAWSASE